MTDRARPHLIHLESKHTTNPLVRCPECKYEARLMGGFSCLEAGFNGVTSGSPDDLDVQECGNCGVKLRW